MFKTKSGKPLKLVDQFPHLSSNISLTETDVNIRIGKELNAIIGFFIQWKSDLPKVVAARLLISHLTNYPSKTNKHWALLGNQDELISDVFLWIYTLDALAGSNG